MMNLKNLKSGAIALAMLLAVLLSSCDPSKRMQRYMYLVDDDKEEVVANDDPPISESTGEPEPPVVHKAQHTGVEVDKVIKEAEKYLGTPYKYGGTTKKGLDCSALTGLAYATVGTSLPRSSSGQSAVGKKVPKKQIRPGDLVFFDAKKSGKITHVGMVVSVKDQDVRFIHATTSRGVRYDDLNGDYWSQRFVVAKRPD